MPIPGFLIFLCHQRFDLVDIQQMIANLILRRSLGDQNIIFQTDADPFLRHI